MENTLTIGEVARRAGVNRETLRYYERRGLVSPSARSDAGYRLYTQAAPRIIRFIKRAQGLGFSLEEIEGLLSLRDNSDRRCAEVKSLAQTRHDDIKAKIGQLKAVRKTLAALVATCGVKRKAPDCPILDALDSESGLP